ncbi:class I SAM-dependent methyltransferase [Streptomyces chumphonensis]|uniref:class I SAM-dependent methyltransferase n=1 Tax=Streptomyces chumphonensis TaxID=1214925 RepID=UPI003D7074A0
MFARLYARLAGPALARAGADEYRRSLLAGLDGEVVEIGAGNGLNFPHYPVSVRRVVAVEPERHLRAMAGRAARTAPVPVEVVDGAAEGLPFPDGAFDAAVACLVLCSVADQERALGEVRRVLRPGGELRFFEHVRSESAGMRRVQGVLDATLWPRLMGGCHTGRDTGAAIAAAGFEVTGLRRLRFPATARATPSSSHILGTAVRP